MAGKSWCAAHAAWEQLRDATARAEAGGAPYAREASALVQEGGALLQALKRRVRPSTWAPGGGQRLPLQAEQYQLPASGARCCGRPCPLLAPLLAPQHPSPRPSLVAPPVHGPASASPLPSPYYSLSQAVANSSAASIADVEGASSELQRVLDAATQLLRRQALGGGGGASGGSGGSGGVRLFQRIFGGSAKDDKTRVKLQVRRGQGADVAGRRRPLSPAAVE
jgi:hypothetical protein